MMRKLWYYIEPFYLVFYFIIAFVVSLVLYPYLLFVQSMPHHEEDGYDV